MSQNITFPPPPSPSLRYLACGMSVCPMCALTVCCSLRYIPVPDIYIIVLHTLMLKLDKNSTNSQLYTYIFTNPTQTPLTSPFMQCHRLCVAIYVWEPEILGFWLAQYSATVIHCMKHMQFSLYFTTLHFRTAFIIRPPAIKLKIEGPLYMLLKFAWVYLNV